MSVRRPPSPITHRRRGDIAVARHAFSTPCARRRAPAERRSEPRYSETSQADLVIAPRVWGMGAAGFSVRQQPGTNSGGRIRVHTGKVTGACPGYVIDHVILLNRGGADEPKNMH